MSLVDDIMRAVAAKKVTIHGVEAAYRITAFWENGSKSLDVPHRDFEILVRSEGATRTELIRSLGL